MKPESPAAKAGLQPSDFILRINGQIVFHMDPKDVERMIANSGFALLLDTERFSNNLIVKGFHFILLLTFAFQKQSQGNDL